VVVVDGVVVDVEVVVLDVVVVDIVVATGTVVDVDVTAPLTDVETAGVVDAEVDATGTVTTTGAPCEPLHAAAINPAANTNPGQRVCTRSSVLNHLVGRATIRSSERARPLTRSSEIGQ